MLNPPNIPYLIKNQAVEMGTRKKMIVVLMFAGLSTTILLQQWSAEYSSDRNNILPKMIVSYDTKPHGYIMGLRYGGQQSGGVGSLASLQCWIKSFDLPLLIAEPAVRHSKLFSTDLKGLRFSDFFDIEKFNNLRVGRKEFGQIAAWDHFLKHAPRSVVYVQINDPKDEDHSISQEWGTSVTIIDTDKCTLPPALQFLVPYKFCITQFVNFTIHGNSPFITNKLYSPFPPEQVHKYLFQQFQPEEVTVIVDHWLPMYCVPNSKLINPEICRKVHYTGRSLIYASAHLLKDVEQYENLFLLPRTTLSVFIRSEHLISWAAMHCLTKEGIVNKTKLTQVFHEYLNAVIVTANNIKRMNAQGNTFVTLDTGKYGSSSWRSLFARGGYEELRESMLQALKETVLTLDNSIDTFEEWEQRFTDATDGTTDAGYIAALQRTIGSRADCLILVGGGTFGLGVLSEYIHNHPDTSEHCYHFLAMASKYRALYRDAVQHLTGKTMKRP